MDSRIEGRIEDWPSRSVANGLAGLRTLADEEFTGAITAGQTRVSMLNGRIIGVFDGTIDGLTDRSLTAYEAPATSLPLLWVMQRSETEPRARYYTKDTPLEEVDKTLSSGGFTGYIELSENVLSGDYYRIYYGGKALSLAFIGESEQLITGDEAFDRAADEIGIYEVFDVTVSIHELPTPDSPSEETASDEEPVESEPPPADTQAAISEPSEEPPTADPETAETATSETSPSVSADRAVSSDQSQPTTSETTERHTIPALDPDQTHRSTDDHSSADSTDYTDTSHGAATPTPTGRQQQTTRLNELTEKLETVTEQRDQLKQERETLKAKVSDLQATNKQLTERVQQLEDQIDTQPTASTDSASGQDLDAATALTQTDLFVRYDSKGQPTLADIPDGTADRSAVTDNLTLDHHTRFDADAVTIDDQPFDVFLRSTMEYQFVQWLVTELLYELIETHAEQTLRDVYRVLPEIDRLQLHGELTIQTETDEGPTDREIPFDVIARDRMGDPLLVARLNDSRDPATGTMIEELTEAATAAAQTHDTLGAAFLVTASFFEPSALETATEAAGGGLLSRDNRQSHVKVSRKQGYHLCLVEARNETLHLTVPDI